jgi:hypothetical protein
MGTDKYSNPQSFEEMAEQEAPVTQQEAPVTQSEPTTTESPKVETNETTE